MELEYSEKADTGVTGANIFFLPKLNPFLPIFFCQEGNNNILFCQSQFSFCQNINKCFSLKTTEKMCKNDKNRQKKMPNLAASKQK